LILRWLSAKLAGRRSQGMLNQKDLLTKSSASVGPAFSGPCRPPKRGDADLLIQKGLLSMLRWTGGERLLNLKDLLPVLPPSLKRVFENGAILRPLFWCRIVPNSAIFCQNMAEYGTKSTFFATGFFRNGLGPAAPEPSERAWNTNWPTGRKHHQSAPPYLPAGGHRISREVGELHGYRYGKTEKINMGLGGQFPPALAESYYCKQTAYQNEWPFSGIFGGTKSCQI